MILTCRDLVRIRRRYCPCEVSLVHDGAIGDTLVEVIQVDE